jgi:hypothetical protein
VEDAEAGIDDRHRQTRDGTKLRPFAGTPFDIGFGEGDGEQADCAWDLEEILASAGWNQLPWGVHAVGIAVIHRNLRPLAGSVGAQNIEIQLEPAHRQGRLAAAEALVATLNSAGIGAREAPYNSANTIPTIGINVPVPDQQPSEESQSGHD